MTCVPAWLALEVGEVLAPRRTRQGLPGARAATTTAQPKCVNVPLALVGTADAKPAGIGLVDVSPTPTVRFPLAYLQMWPHARPWKFGSPQPMLRAVPEAFVPQLADALAKADPARVAATRDAASVPALAGGSGMSVEFTNERLPKSALYAAGALIAV